MSAPPWMTLTVRPTSRWTSSGGSPLVSRNERSGSFRWGATFTYAYLGDNNIDTTNFAGRVVGDYDTSMPVISAYGSWTF